MLLWCGVCVFLRSASCHELACGCVSGVVSFVWRCMFACHLMRIVLQPHVCVSLAQGLMPRRPYSLRIC